MIASSYGLGADCNSEWLGQSSHWALEIFDGLGMDWVWVCLTP